MKRELSASDLHAQMYPEHTKYKEYSRDVTFQLTEYCNLQCFVKGTKILMHDYSYKNIEDIEIGDKVVGFNFRTNDNSQIYPEITTVTRLFKNFGQVRKITSSSGDYVICTDEHPFLSDRKTWRLAKNITNKTTLEMFPKLNYPDNISEVTFINEAVVDNQQLSKQEDVYNFETENHTYIANNFLCHNCSYCYQIAKTRKRMTWEVGKQIVDLLFKMYDDDIEGAFITSHTKQIILDFIGGEPLLEIELMDKICDYFWTTAILKNHEWADTFMVSMASNGTLYFDDRVQKFFQKFKGHLSFSVSIDGPKEMHDACRVFPDGSGSFDLAKAAQDDYNERFYNSIGTKATIAKENLPYFSELIRYYVGQGFERINANCVYEADWNEEDAALLYKELKETADYLLNLDHEVYLSYFEDIFFKPKSEDDLQTWCGGTGAMLAFDPDGTAYPCVRYMPTSLGVDIKPIVIGNCFDGFYVTEEDKQTRKDLEAVDRRTQSTEECFYCPIAEGCSYCSAWNMQCFGTCDSRCTHICIMHKARSLANVYYWNKRYEKEGTQEYFHRWLTDEEALKIISKEELNYLDSLERKDLKMHNDITFDYDYKKYTDNIGQNEEEKRTGIHISRKKETIELN